MKLIHVRKPKALITIGYGYKQSRKNESGINRADRKQKSEKQLLNVLVCLPITFIVLATFIIGNSSQNNKQEIKQNVEYNEMLDRKEALDTAVKNKDMEYLKKHSCYDNVKSVIINNTQVTCLY